MVDDTDASIAFYRDALGLRVAGSGENHGIEQERLNNVFGVRLRITTLRAPAGPGIELLEYVAPGGGRGYPGDSAMSDLWSWRTTLVTADTAQALGVAAQGGARWISPGVIDSPPPEVSLDDAAMLRDPDGTRSCWPSPDPCGASARNAVRGPASNPACPCPHTSSRSPTP